MRILLDTQVWLWIVAEPERLSAPSRALVVSTANELLLSAASAWEIAIKYGLGTLQLPEAPALFVPRLMSRTAVTPLPVHHAHALRVATLPVHHRDPFDRLLVAQAQNEELPLMTADGAFSRYDLDIIPA